jgi:hypothetical protein
MKIVMLAITALALFSAGIDAVAGNTSGMMWALNTAVLAVFTCISYRD